MWFFLGFWYFCSLPIFRLYPCQEEKLLLRRRYSLCRMFVGCLLFLNTRNIPLTRSRVKISGHVNSGREIDQPDEDRDREIPATRKTYSCSVWYNESLECRTIRWCDVRPTERSADCSTSSNMCYRPWQERLLWSQKRQSGRCYQRKAQNVFIRLLNGWFDWFISRSKLTKIAINSPCCPDRWR